MQTLIDYLIATATCLIGFALTITVGFLGAMVSNFIERPQMRLFVQLLLLVLILAPWICGFAAIGLLFWK